MFHRIIQDDADLTRLRETWSALLETHPRPLLPLSWEWISSWWESFRGGEPHSRHLHLWIHVFENERGPCAIIPLVRMRYRLRGIPVWAAGSMANGHSPLWDAILHPDLGTQELDEIGGLLLGCPEIELWLFQRIAADSRLLHWLNHRVGTMGRFGVLHTLRTPLVRTVGDWEAYLGQRSRMYRKGLRKKIRVFDAHSGTSVERVSLRSGTDPVLEEVVEVSRRSWKRKVGHDLHSDSAGRAFLVRIIDRVGPHNQAEVWLARLNGRPIAYELHFRGAGVTYPIRADYDEDYGHLSPGSVVEYRAVESAFSDPAIEVYDTCAADYCYLRKLTDEVREVHDAAVFSRQPRSTALYLFEFWLMPVLRLVQKTLRPRRSTD